MASSIQPAMAQVHIIGAGLAGLACAVDLIAKKHTANAYRVIVYEAAPHAGGRCRSFFDAHLGCVIDNGNHLVLSANHAVRHYLTLIEAQDHLLDTGQARFPFIDVQTGEQWTIHPNKGRIPWWIFIDKRRVGGTRLREYWSIITLLMAKHTDTIATCLSINSVLYRRFWEPLVLAILNTPPQQASAVAIKKVFLETFARGSEYCRPLVADDGLGASFIDPALAWLRQRGGEIYLSTRVRGLHFEDTRVVALDVGDHRVMLQPNDCIVLAVSLSVARQLLSEVIMPHQHQPIVNVHFRLESPPLLPQGVKMIGMVNSKAQWVFVRGSVVSVTISAAETMIDVPSQQIATTLWQEVSTAFGFRDAQPRYRVIKEHRATFAQTPENLQRRPRSRTRWSNLFLAGDWTDTGVPATIEGALRSGFTAAKGVLASLNRTEDK